MGGEKITWNTEKRKISELTEFKSNPRRLTTKQHEDLKKSIDKFGLVEIPAINKNGTILAGHMRIRILSDKFGKEYEIEVRAPSRQLSEDEEKEYLIRSNRNTGEWDYDKLANEFKEEDLTDWGFEDKELFGEEETPPPKEEKDKYDKMSFELAEEQHQFVTSILDQVKKKATYKFIETYGNTSANGNALYALCCDCGMK